MAKEKKTAKPRLSATGEPLVRVTVLVLPQTHMDFAIMCVDLDMGMGDRLLQLIQAFMDGQIELVYTPKVEGKFETHTKHVVADAPKSQHMLIRKFCLRNSYTVTDLSEKLILWDLENQGALLAPAA